MLVRKRNLDRKCHADSTRIRGDNSVLIPPDDMKIVKGDVRMVHIGFRRGFHAIHAISKTIDFSFAGKCRLFLRVSGNPVTSGGKTVLVVNEEKRLGRRGQGRK